ncbi:hypothetical protein ACX12E_19010 [Paenibacillus vandeheii]
MNDKSHRLFVHQPDSTNVVNVVYLMPTEWDGTGFTLEQALHRYNGTFVISAKPLLIGTKRETRELVDGLKAVVKSRRGIVWLKDPLVVKANTVFTVWFGRGQTVEHETSLLINGNRFKLNLPEGTQVDIEDEGHILFAASSRSGEFELFGEDAPHAKPFSRITVPLEGSESGCFKIESLYLNSESLMSPLKVGFQFSYPRQHEDSARKVGYYPLLRNSDGGFIEFKACFDPCYLHGYSDFTRLRDYFHFTGRNEDESQTKLESAYSTKYGYPVQLTPISNTDTPAMLVLQRMDGRNSMLLGPAGKFSLSVKHSIEDGRMELLCGLSSLESFSFLAGDFIVFTPFQPAYAPRYPFAPSKPNGAPTEVVSSLLKSSQLTSYAKLIPMDAPQSTNPPSVQFLSQPAGNPYFGRGALHQQYAGLFFDFQDTFISFQEDHPPFPLVPYGRVTEDRTDGVDTFKMRDYADFETNILAPIRRHVLKIQRDPDTLSFISEEEIEQQGYTATTPSGQLVAIQGSQFAKVLLGKAASEGADLSFIRLTEQLQTAFQTNQLFLVAASSKFLGEYDESDPGKPGFNNQIDFEGWKLQVDTGTNDRYGDYHDVIIIKGGKGTRAEEGKGLSILELANKPELWTQSHQFSARASHFDSETEAAADVMGLSKWLSDYLNDPIIETDEAFDPLKTLIRNKSWTGVLILKASLSAFPAELDVIATGMDASDMYAHHLVSGATSVSTELLPTDKSAMSGLIHYVHPQYITTDASSDVVVKPEPDDFDFKVLKLKVVIDQGTIKDFFCRCQLTVNKILGHEVKHIGGLKDACNTMLIDGNDTRHSNGVLSYVFGLKRNYVYRFTSQLLERVEITGVRLNQGANRYMRPDGVEVKEQRFNLDGYIGFHEIPGFDVMSFGLDQKNVAGIEEDTPEEALRLGLCFSNLGIIQTLPVNSNSTYFERKFQDDPLNMQFDMRSSYARANSLFKAFPLTLKGIKAGSGGLDKEGFLPIALRTEMTGVRDKHWHALHYQLDLGTSGALSGLTLSAELLLAWIPDQDAPEHTYRLAMGLKLPAPVKRFQIEGVLELEFGQIFLNCDGEVFSLLFNPIVLRFLGFQQLPPSGAMVIELFGSGKEQKIGWYGMYRDGRDVARQ